MPHDSNTKVNNLHKFHHFIFYIKIFFSPSPKGVSSNWFPATETADIGSRESAGGGGSGGGATVSLVSVSGPSLFCHHSSPRHHDLLHPE